MKLITFFLILLSLNSIAQEIILEKSINHPKVDSIIKVLTKKYNTDFVIINNQLISSNSKIKSNNKIINIVNAAKVNFIEFEEVKMTETKASIFFNINSVYIIDIELIIINNKWCYNSIDIIDNN